MSESNGAWGDHHNGDRAREATWEDFQHYDQIPENAPTVLVQWCERKALTVEDLKAYDCRWTVDKGAFTLVYLFPDGIKYRAITEPPKRWSTNGQWVHARIERRDKPEGVIVAEGETDSMQLMRRYPSWDIACVPNGAKNISLELLGQLQGYSQVLVALDDDGAGNQGAQTILDTLPRTAHRMLPPINDWCTTAAHQPLDASPWVYVRRIDVPIFTLGEIVATDFGTYEDNNWFEEDILPFSGLCLIHAPQKSLKSVILADLIRAASTGTAFAGEGGYGFIRPDGPARVLWFQMEVRPFEFQSRVIGQLAHMPDEERELYLRNVMAYKIGDHELPRLSVNQKDFKATIFRAIEQAGKPEILAFDPLQRLSGDADLDRANEMNKLLDLFAELQNEGFTVISCHHNNKASGAGAKGPGAMIGTQRFGGDPDSICSVYHAPKAMVDDDNPERRKQRNFTWTLRNGAARDRSIDVRPDPENEQQMLVRFGPPIKEKDIDYTTASVSDAPGIS